MIYIKQFLLLAAIFIVSANSSAENDLLTRKNLKALNKAIEKHFPNNPKAEFSELNQFESHNNLTVVEILPADKTSPVGWGTITEAKGRFDFFDFLALYNQNKELVHLEILRYPSSHGYQVTSRKWLRQFTGLTTKDTIKVGQQVDGISGATLSVNGLVQRLNDLSKIIMQIKM